MYPANNNPTTVLYGSASASVAAVVAVEPAGQFVRVFSRASHGVTFRDYPFKPFLLLADPLILATIPIFSTRQQLAGNGPLCWLVEVTTWHDWCLLRDYLQKNCRPETWFGIADRCQQFLITSGIHFFSGLSFDQVTVLTLAVTTDAAEMQPRYKRVTSIALADSGGYAEVLRSSEMAEPEMLERLSRIIQDKDPDVLSGYRLTGFDLPTLVKRAEQYGLRLGWGRDGSEPRLLQGADKHGSQKNYSVYGRSLIDTLSLVRHYDHQVCPLPGTGLREVAAWFGCDSDQDALAVMGLYQRLAPLWHQQAQYYPVSFQTAVTRPAADALSALLIREYLQQRHSLPAPAKNRLDQVRKSSMFFQRGQAGPVVLWDLSEVPSSIMLSYRIAPHGDALNRFLPLLHAARSFCDQQQKADGLSLPSLLLSAWPELLASTHLPFSDSAAAAELKRLGSVMTADLLGWLRDEGAIPVLADQQTICFVPPKGHNGAEALETVMRRLAEMLPGGARLRCSGLYRSVFVYSQNNFALLEQNGTMVYRGSRFSSRSMEPFLLEFLKEALTLLLANRAEEVRNLYARYLRRLSLHTCPVSWVMRTETLADTTEHYLQAVQTGKRNRAAVYELALATPEAWRVGDKISYYVAGNTKHSTAHECCRFVTDFNPAHPDLNIPWYVERLDQLFKRLEPFLPEEPLLF